MLADFLCSVADQSERPQSQIKAVMAALSHLYHGLGCMDITHTFQVRQLICALVKSSTTKPMQQSKVMPVEPFHDMFVLWEDNDRLPIEKLRLKCICLLALLFMCRPSDLAPKGVIFDPVTMQEKAMVLSTKQVSFPPSGGVSLKFLGVKNDTSHTGFSVTIPRSSVAKLDVARALQVYIARTAMDRPLPDSPCSFS